jgi:transcriptional regulator PpsR
MEPSQTDQAARLSDFAPELASTVVRVAGDIALVIGDDGVIRTVAEGAAALHQEGQQWVGRPWVDTVGQSARKKVELLLHEAQQHGVSQRRELNHPSPNGGDIPFSWAAVRLGSRGPVLAVGRDLRAIGAIQQRFLDAQQELEREYWLRRQTESRYRQLFQVAQDAVVVLDAATLTVLEANPAAGPLFETPGATMTGHTLNRWLESSARASLDELLITARATGRAAEVRLRVVGSGTAIDLSATPFRAEEQHCLLLRARRAVASATDPQAVLDFVSQTPDAVVVTDSAGRVLWSNAAFVELCEAPSESRLRGRQLADALGGDPLQWSTLLARVRTRGIVGHATVALRTPGSPALMTSVSAALLAEGDQEHIGFTLRPATLAAPVGSATELALDVTQLVDRLGQLSLPELLSEASRMAELHFIQAALRSSGGQLDAAAATLGMKVPALLLRMNQLGLSLHAPVGISGGAPSLN